MSETGEHGPEYDAVVASATRIVETRAGRARLDAHDRKDLLQEVLLKFFTTWGEDRPENVDAWLETTTQNALIDHVRRSGREADRRVDPEEDLLEQLLSRAISPKMTSFEAIKRPMRNRLFALVDSEEADLLRRRYLGNERSAEIAAALGLAVNTVDQKLSRARRKLLDKLKDHPEFTAELQRDHPRLY